MSTKKRKSETKDKRDDKKAKQESKDKLKLGSKRWIYCSGESAHYDVNGVSQFSTSGIIKISVLDDENMLGIIDRKIKGKILTILGSNLQLNPRANPHVMDGKFKRTNDWTFYLKSGDYKCIIPEKGIDELKL